MKPAKLTLPSLLVIMLSCSSISPNTKQEGTKDFNSYWYRGKAEITSYKLTQARYGETHEGYAVLVFVTEDFSKSKQVKLDNPSMSKDDVVKILKLNITKKFNTGIYPYSMMESIFTPVDLAIPSIKFTASTQEWCGQTFTQMNAEENHYNVSSRSYFESEGDREFKLDKQLAEDEIWNVIRIAPEKLPIGKVKLIPGLFFQRLRHQELKVEVAIASLTVGTNSNRYTLNYPDQNRTLEITFRNQFPYEILSWEESYVSGWGKYASRLTTKATRMKSLLIDYWNRHNTSDLGLRKKLHLPN